MPRRPTHRDDGESRVGAPRLFSGTVSNGERHHAGQNGNNNETDFDDDMHGVEYSSGLTDLERRLRDDVDHDFFEDPKVFQTLHRVIDVLGLQLIDDATAVSGITNATLDNNPAYRDLKRQQDVVEKAIQQMSMQYFQELNGSVVQVGKVARRFDEAVSKVRMLRRQVREIQETIGAATSPSNPNEARSATTASSAGNAPAVHMSLRELWLKKLECEAVLSLLDRLDVIRAAPRRFDYFVRAPCRIGAAVLLLSQALATMFSDDVAQVQALHKIMEQLMLRKQRAEELIWDTLQDILFLRTGNGFMQPKDEVVVKKSTVPDTPTSSKAASAHTLSSESRRKTGIIIPKPEGPILTTHGIFNPFQGRKIRFGTNDDEIDNGSVGSEDSCASLFSLEDDDDETVREGVPSSPHLSTSFSLGKSRRMTVPIPMIEAELDLEADERRCLETALVGIQPQQTMHHYLPRYGDPLLALRIMVECIARLRRLDDVERILNESLEREIKNISQREQLRTFVHLEKRGVLQGIRTARTKRNDLKDFRRHWTRLLSAYGCVMVRLTHLAQIVRFRIGADRDLVRSVANPNAMLSSVLTSALSMMQKELKEFLRACTHEESVSSGETLGNAAKTSHERGLFSLGIIDVADKDGSNAIGLTSLSKASRANVMEMPIGKFVASVLFAHTNETPHVQHALVFRRSLDRWNSETAALKRELAEVSGEELSSGPNAAQTGDTAIEFLDGIIQNRLLPVLQQDGVNATVVALEMNDAFEPVLDRTVFAQPRSSSPLGVEMCKACQVLFNCTAPLFAAIHRLPPGGEMYLPLVAVLEHVILTFLSRVKAQVAYICNNKTAFRLLMEQGKAGGSFGAILERRRPFLQLLRAYELEESMEPSHNDVGMKQNSGIMPLSPPASDTDSRYSNIAQSPSGATDLDNNEAGVEREEEILHLELSYLRPIMDYMLDSQRANMVMCADEELMKAACLAHSLLKVSSLLESRLKVRAGGFTKKLSSTRALREAIKTLKMNGVKMAKFCRIDMLLQTVSKLSKICKSSTLIARDAVRIPSTVNELGEYLTGSSDYLREAAGNAVTAYTFSSLEQYIPRCLIETVRVIGNGEGIILKAPLTMNGIEALDRSGSVLYRDLKGATSFDNSFWDVELAALSFERSASFIAMMELEMEELVAYYTQNRDDFSEEDFELMFGMDGPRRRGDLGRYNLLRENLDDEVVL